MSGRERELSISTEIYRRTSGRVFAEPIGYSGNHDIPAPDIRIDTGQKVHAVEYKTTGADRKSVYYDPDNRGKDDIDQLLTYSREYPRTVVPHIGVEFSRRQATVATLYPGSSSTEKLLEKAAKSCETDVSATYANNLSFRKPSSSEWPSTQRGDSVRYLLDRIGYEGPLDPPV